MSYVFRKATLKDVSAIWEILQYAIEKRKQEGSEQWQDGYPNVKVINNDIEKKVGYVLEKHGTIIGYVAIFINDEPEYKNINGKWISNKDFIACHRLAVAKDYLGKGMAKKIMSFIEEFALKKNIYSIKADTNFDNEPMLNLFRKFDYIYCGEVVFRNSPRDAFEKVLS